MSNHDVTRRQFLNYTLLGVGGFMAAGLVLPMARFAIDPLLQDNTTMGGFTKIDLQEKDLTETPQKVTFTVKDVQDGWYTFDEDKTAYVFKTDEGEIMALSDVCTHLGCTVSWTPEPPNPNEFYCPCHGGRYTKEGVNIAGTPPTEALPVYEVKVENGDILLGPTQARNLPPASPS